MAEKKKWQLNKQRVMNLLNSVDLRDAPDDVKKQIVCAIVGHSRIVGCCFGQVTCARCDAIDNEIGHITDDQIVMGIKTVVQLDLYSKMGWKDKLMAPDPFAKKEGG